MLRTRVIPVLLLRNESLVKTVRFGKFTYVGDPCNTVRIFNELEVDELLFLDITATPDKRSPNLRVLSEIADECFMPLGYGGGVRDFETAKAIFEIGFEKVALNSFALEQPQFVTRLAEHFGNQSVVASVDVKKDLLGRYRVHSEAGKRNTGRNPVEWAQELEALGAGEILLTSIDREGSWAGFDVELVHAVAQAVTVPVIAHGGAGSVKDIGTVVREGGASAVAVGSMVVFQKKGMGVLVNFPSQEAIRAELE
ncbi:AglZ/HisF2 family acetamidino modification protein [Geomonas anaerohicana]|uniref:imidazole glycerol-phosphate synthase n=1 Tax=Geomonas anaerohicana TaxID=2798583 RepID=A0ABS0YBL3_9BACT|nr:AglZ/HisF2 family acetamidino modification protein [Geomonas anaerohicana]MBJ6749682.1 imidazole glycerol phosphate synthase subunit HisF [Geomonas anaerohicana]